MKYIRVELGYALVFLCFGYETLKSFDRFVFVRMLISFYTNAFQECLLCPTGFSANMAVMATLGCISSLLSNSRKPLENEKVAIFSDSLNHASIIDGIRHAERLQEVKAFVYRHSDMAHLRMLL